MDDLTVELMPQLRALVELVAHDGHITSAAAALGVPQSSMSRRLRSLEAALGVSLVIRDGRRLRLTGEARRLADAIRSSLGEVGSALADVREAGDISRGTVRFGFPLTMGEGAVPELLVAFSRLHPGIRLHLKQSHGSSLISDLQRGELDLAITIPAPPDLDHRVIDEQEICAVVADSHRLASASELDLSELAGESFIANPSSYHLRRMTEKWCRESGFEPMVTVEITEFATMREFIGRGLGVGLLPAADSHGDEVVQIPLVGEHRRSVALVSAAVMTTPATRALGAFLTERWAQI